MLPLRLSAETSATDSVVQNKRYRLDTIVLVISNKKMKDIMKIVESLERLQL